MIELDEETTEILNAAIEEMNKDFKEAPVFELVDEVYALGKKAMSHYGEKAFGDFLVNLAFHYKSRGFEMQEKRIKVENLLQNLVGEQEPEPVASEEPQKKEKQHILPEVSDEDLDTIIEEIDFDNLDPQ